MCVFMILIIGLLDKCSLWIAAVMTVTSRLYNITLCIGKCSQLHTHAHTYTPEVFCKVNCFYMVMSVGMILPHSWKNENSMAYMYLAAVIRACTTWSTTSIFSNR